MKSTLSAAAAGALMFWALIALSDQQQPQPQPTPTQAVVVPEPKPWKQPDPRTLTTFPGP